VNSGIETSFVAPDGGLPKYNSSPGESNVFRYARDVRSAADGTTFSTKQAIAIGLSKARRAGIDLPAPRKGTTSERTRRTARRDVRRGQQGGRRKPSAKRSRATMRALKREGRAAASKQALSRHAKQSVRRRGR